LQSSDAGRDAGATDIEASRLTVFGIATVDAENAAGSGIHLTRREISRYNRRFALLSIFELKEWEIMKIRIAVPALLALLIASAAWGQGGSAPTAAGGKVAVINIQSAITGTAEGKQAAAELQSQFTPRQNELDSLRKKIDDLQNRLRNGATTLSDEEKARLQREGESATRVFQRKQQEMQDDANDAQREVVDRIGRKMLEVIDKFSKENGYSVVFDISAQNTPVVYAANQNDITQDIVRLFDQAYPVKASATPKPAAPKPAAPAKPQQ